MALFAQQQIPNHDFENWTNGEPDNWGTSNENVMGIVQFTTVTQETAAPYSGSYAAKVETVSENLLGSPITMPGILTLGTFELDIVNQSGDVVGGIPFTGRPDKLHGFFKSQPVGNDQSVVGIGLSKWRGTHRDTIGQGYIVFSNTVTTWTPFEITINWSTAETPDSMNIIVSASDILNEVFVAGSTVWVDSLYLEYIAVPTANKEIAKVQLGNYPNPFSDETVIRFTASHSNNYRFTVYNILGELVFEKNYKAHKGINRFSFSAEGLDTGLYIYRIESGYEVETKIMHIAR